MARSTSIATSHETVTAYCCVSLVASLEHTPFMFCNSMMVRLLLSVDRRGSIDDARATIDLARHFLHVDHGALMVGVDFSGNPTVGSFRVCDTYTTIVLFLLCHGILTAIAGQLIAIS